VHVVAARVTHARDGRAVGHPLLVLHRKGVDIRAKSYHATFWYIWAYINDEAGSLGQDGRPKSGGGQPKRYVPRRTVLSVPCLRVRVQITAEADQIRRVSGPELV
jgi:hypothetical protein